jgi:hypothetical protein
MPDAKVERALRLLDELDRNREMPPRDVEYAIHEVLTAAGYAVSTPSPGKPDIGIDMELRGCIDGKPERVGVEVKSHKGRVSGQTIYRAMDAMRAARLDRVLIVALGGYSPLALARAGIERLGKVDLLDMNHPPDPAPSYARFGDPSGRGPRGDLPRRMARYGAFAGRDFRRPRFRDVCHPIGKGWRYRRTPHRFGGRDLHSRGEALAH